MKSDLVVLFEKSLQSLQHQGVLLEAATFEIKFERARQKEHGDFACNIAMMLSKQAKQNPRELAELIIQGLPENQIIKQIEVAGPGFINIFVNEVLQQQVIHQVLSAGSGFGVGGVAQKKKILVEFVSANPTGPLHVGHGRGAAYGDTLARLLTAAGHDVKKEYYVNDAGRQMDILATSLWLRFLQLNNVDFSFPENFYQGDYLLELAKNMFKQHQGQYLVDADKVKSIVARYEQEQAIDQMIILAKSHLGKENYSLFFDVALNTILADIKEDLAGFGIEFDDWFSEASLSQTGGQDNITQVFEKLKQSGHVYQNEDDKAWWFKSTEFGDEKDRVVIRANGAPTYFASDIAYHVNKFERDFDECINIWGADHHGYIARVKAALTALGIDENRLRVLLVQFASLYQDGKKLSMSSRQGQFVTLRVLREEVGEDAARFFYVQRKSEQHMDFDLDLAKSQSNENPVYYVQYAHARISSVLREAKNRSIANGIEFDASLLQSDQEVLLMSLLTQFPEKVQKAAHHYEPHQIVNFLRELATAFHSYYNQVNFLGAKESYRNAVLALTRAVKQVLINGLNIVGVNAPEKM